MSDELEDLKKQLAAMERLAEDLLVVASAMQAALKSFVLNRAAGKQRQQALIPTEPTAWTADSDDLLKKKATGIAIANRELSDQMVAIFKRVTGADYVFDGAKDAQAVQRLVRLRFEDREELLARWEQAIKLAGYPGTKSIAVFAMRVNEYGTAGAKKQPISAPPVGDPYT